MSVGCLGLSIALLLLGCVQQRAAAPCDCRTAAPPPCGSGAAPQVDASAAPPYARTAEPAPSQGGSLASDAGPAVTEAQLLARYEGKGASSSEHGKATYYSDALSGRKTASGEPYDPQLFTAAHKQLPLGTVVRVVRVDTNRYVYVRINDRGPFGNRERIIDLSKIAATRLGMLRAGVVPVRVEILR